MIAVGVIASGKYKYDWKYPTVVVKSPKNVTKAKNKLLKDFVAQGYEKIFLLTDEVIIKDPVVFEIFSTVSDKTGFECMTYCKQELSNDQPIYTKDPYVSYWHYPGNAFVFYTKNAIEQAGYLDEKFPTGTWEDIEHIKRIGDLALTAPFGMFVGIKNEDTFLDVNKEIAQKRVERETKMKKEQEEGIKYWQAKDPERFPSIGETKHVDLKIK